MKPDHRQIERDLIEPRNRNAIGDEREQPAMERDRQRETGDAARKRQQHAFRQHLAQQPAALRAERGAQAQLALAHRAARQQQVGDVDAGDQQHEQHRAAEDEQRRADLLDGLLVNRHQRDRPAGVALRRFLFELRAMLRISSCACSSETPSRSRAMACDEPRPGAVRSRSSVQP